MHEAKPKLLLFSHLCSATYITGAEKLLLLFVRELMHRYECVLVVPREGIISARARSLGIRVEVFDIPLCLSLYYARASMAVEIDSMKRQLLYQKLLAFIVRQRPSCVWVNTSVHPLPALAAKSLGIPTVWSIMETIASTGHRKLALDIISSNCDAIIGISRSTLQPFQGHAGRLKTFVLPPYLDRVDMEPESWPDHRKSMRRHFGWGEEIRVVGFIAAAIYSDKGLEPFVKAAIALGLEDPRSRFVVVGNPVDPEYVQKCQTLISLAGLADRFGWVPFVDHIEQVYPGMDIVVVPSLVPEGFGMTALEGMFFGKPVIAFSSGGLEEILTATGNERFLVSNANVTDLAIRLQMLIVDDALRAYAGEWNKQTAQNLYGVDSFRARLDELAHRLTLRLHPLSPLIRCKGRKTVFLLQHGRRRPFVSFLALQQRGFGMDDVRRVEKKELRSIPRGSSIREIRLRKTTRVHRHTKRNRRMVSRLTRIRRTVKRRILKRRLAKRNLIKRTPMKRRHGHRKLRTRLRQRRSMR